MIWRHGLIFCLKKKKNKEEKRKEIVYAIHLNLVLPTLFEGRNNQDSFSPAFW